MASRLSFFTIVVILLIIFALAWLVYWIVKRRKERNHQPPPPSPTDLWFHALIQHPRVFLLVATLVPLILSFIAYAQSGYKININLDFDSYLKIQTDLDSIAENYALAQAEQATLASSTTTTECSSSTIGIRSRSLEWNSRSRPNEVASFSIRVEPYYHDNEHEEATLERELFYDGENTYASTGPKLSLIYQNRNGGNVFEPEVLESIRDFEQSILDFPGFRNVCFGFGGGRCVPFDSLIPDFFPNGYLVEDTESVLRSFLGDPQAIWKMDQYFGPDHLSSNITRTFIWFRDFGDNNERVKEFFKGFYHNFLWKIDQERHPLVYPHMVYTWDNVDLEDIEAHAALSHDTIWSIGSFLFIGLMIFLKVRNFFVFFFSMLGLATSFTTALYWCSVHFGIHEITLLHVAGLFVMLGIGADDIFLMLDSFDHTKLEFDCVSNPQGSTDEEENEDEDDSVRHGTDTQRNAITTDPHEVLGQRMRSAYHTAGSMMLVSSVTTAVCFFSNAFGILEVIQEFGIYMGVVVVLNYVHVMTILPSAILVNEMYIMPWIQEKWNKPSATAEQSGQKSPPSDNEDPESGVTTPPVESAAVHDHEMHGTYLDDTSKMNKLDRWLVGTYVPFVTKRRVLVLLFSIILALILCCVGIVNFKMSDGSIVLFNEKYNLGRLRVINDAYYNAQLSKTVEQQPALPPVQVPTSPTIPPPTMAPVATLSPTITVPTVEPAPAVPTPGIAAGFSTAAQPPPSGGGSSGGSGTFVQVPTSWGSTVAPTSGGSTVAPTSGGSTVAPTSFSASDGSSSGGAPTSAQMPTSSSGGSDLGGSSSSGGAPTSAQMPTSSGGGSDFTPTSYSGSNSYIYTNSNPSSSSCSEDCENGGVCVKGLCECKIGWTGPSCSLPSEMQSIKRREAIVVSLIWGVEPTGKDSSLWLIKKDSHTSANNNRALSSGFEQHLDLSDPEVQQWFLDVADLARNETDLNVRSDKLTWIEILHDAAVEDGVGFPIPQSSFVEYFENLKSTNCDFAELVSKSVGNSSPDLNGDFLFAGMTLYADVMPTKGSLSMTSYKRWSSFAESANQLKPPHVPPVVAYSPVFVDAYRTEETISSTVTTWIVANVLCLVIILLFIQNVLLSLMVMVTIMLIFLCLAGLLFAIFNIPFGPVEALGVSIFIGLSANYSLHVGHAYLHSKGIVRNDKVKEAVFVTGSPILASGLSTIGGAAFLFGCRTWAFVELGILICCITAMALFYCMAFLVAWLAMVGPLPYENNRGNDHQGHGVHQWDITALFFIGSRKLNLMKKNDTDLSDDNKDGLNDGSSDVKEKEMTTRTDRVSCSGTSFLGEDSSAESSVSSSRCDDQSPSCNETAASETYQQGNDSSKNKVQHLKKRQKAIESWHEGMKQGSNRSLDSYLLEASLSEE